MYIHKGRVPPLRNAGCCALPLLNVSISCWLGAGVYLDSLDVLLMLSAKNTVLSGMNRPTACPSYLLRLAGTLPSFWHHLCMCLLNPSLYIVDMVEL